MSRPEQGIFRACYSCCGVGSVRSMFRREAVLVLFAVCACHLASACGTSNGNPTSRTPTPPQHMLSPTIATATATPMLGGCGFTCDNRPCIGQCADGSMRSGSCTRSTPDSCECELFECPGLCGITVDPVPSVWDQMRITLTGSAYFVGYLSYDVQVDGGAEPVSATVNYDSRPFSIEVPLNPGLNHLRFSARASGPPGCHSEFNFDVVVALATVTPATPSPTCMPTPECRDWSRFCDPPDQNGCPICGCEGPTLTPTPTATCAPTPPSCPPCSHVICEPFDQPECPRECYCEGPTPVSTCAPVPECAPPARLVCDAVCAPVQCDPCRCVTDSPTPTETPTPTPTRTPECRTVGQACEFQYRGRSVLGRCGQPDCVVGFPCPGLFCFPSDDQCVNQSCGNFGAVCVTLWSGQFVEGFCDQRCHCLYPEGPPSVTPSSSETRTPTVTPTITHTVSECTPSEFGCISTPPPSRTRSPTCTAGANPAPSCAYSGPSFSPTRTRSTTPTPTMSASPNPSSTSTISTPTCAPTPECPGCLTAHCGPPRADGCQSNCFCEGPTPVPTCSPGPMCGAGERLVCDVHCLGSDSCTACRCVFGTPAPTATSTVTGTPTASCTAGPNPAPGCGYEGPTFTVTPTRPPSGTPTKTPI